MLPTLRPARSRLAIRCIAVVDLPDPPFSLPTTITRARSVGGGAARRSEEHTSELQSLMRISYAVFCLKKKKTLKRKTIYRQHTARQVVISKVYKTNGTQYD